MEQQQPSVGRNVHFADSGGVCRAAMITAVVQGGIGDVIDAVSLAIFLPSGAMFEHHIPYDERKGVGTWHWPERV